MSGIIDTIFGGSKSKQTSDSGNTAYPWIQSNFGPTSASAYNGGLGSVMNLLNGNSDQSQQQLQNFWNSTGGNFLLNQGIQGVNNNMYARGLGMSGADMKGLEEFRSGLASTKLQDLINDELGAAKVSLGGGDLVANAGQFSHGQSSGSSSSGGLGSFLGGLLAFA